MEHRRLGHLHHEPDCYYCCSAHRTPSRTIQMTVDAENRVESAVAAGVVAAGVVAAGVVTVGGTESLLSCS